MFNGKYTTLNRVLENIERDNGYENQIQREDVKEWAVRAMNLIGVDIPYETVIYVDLFKDYRLVLPQDLTDIIGIRDNVTKIALVASTDLYLSSLPDQDRQITGVSGPSFQNTTVPSYKIVNGYVFFNFKEGEVEMAYKRYMLDENGCLMIPDVDRYLMGIEAYLTYKIDHKLARRGELDWGVAQRSEQEWLWYVNSAANKLLTPNYDEAEVMNRRAQSMRNPMGSHSRGFGTLNYPTIKRF